MDAEELVDPATHAYPALHAPSQIAVNRPLTDPYRPAAHGPLQLAVIRPSVLPYSPALQLVQDPAPASENRPAGQIDAVELTDPAAHAYPALQVPTHDDDVSPLIDPKRPASHGPLHVDTFMAASDPYRPALQLVQAPAPLKLYVPAGQVTAVALTDAAGHAYPAVQRPLHAADGRPAVDPYTPAGQSVHTPALANEYVPAAQVTAIALTDPAGHANPALHIPLQPAVVL
jgi:hypothetical protein